MTFLNAQDVRKGARKMVERKTDNKHERIKRLRDILPLFWNSYQHMYDARERKAKGMIDFLLIISTFLPILSVTLYTTDLFDNVLILLPIIPQIVSIVILLKYFVVNTPAVHWFKLDKNLLDGLDNGNFEIITISALKKLEGFTWVSMNEESKLITRSRNLILSSLFILSLSVLFILFNASLYFYLSFLGLIVVSYYVFFVYYKKTPDFSKEEKNFQEFSKLLNEWVNEK